MSNSHSDPIVQRVSREMLTRWYEFGLFAEDRFHQLIHLSRSKQILVRLDDRGKISDHGYINRVRHDEAKRG